MLHVYCTKGTPLGFVPHVLLFMSVSTRAAGQIRGKTLQSAARQFHATLTRMRSSRWLQRAGAVQTMWKPERIQSSKQHPRSHYAASKGLPHPQRGPCQQGLSAGTTSATLHNPAPSNPHNQCPQPSGAQFLGLLLHATGSRQMFAPCQKRTGASQAGSNGNRWPCPDERRKLRNAHARHARLKRRLLV